MQLKSAGERHFERTGEADDDRNEREHVRGRSGDVCRKGGRGAELPPAEPSEEDERKEDRKPCITSCQRHVNARKGHKRRTGPALDGVQDAVAAERDEHADDGDNDDAGVDREVAGVDSGEHLARDDRVDRAEADEGDEVEEGGEDGRVVAVTARPRDQFWFSISSRLKRTCSGRYPSCACPTAGRRSRHRR